ncbi:hypothetical protein PENTCL1PPCAC_21711, partial [Pristionchus entomophagus]
FQLCKESITNWLSKNMHDGSRPIRQTMSWFYDLVKGVAHIHRREYIHRDLKPCNILLSDDERIKVTDMGLTLKQKIIDDVEMPVSQDGWRSRNYMSPEQASDFLELNSKSDVFTLGLILAELRIVLTSEDKNQIFDNYRRGTQINIFDNDLPTAEFVAKLTKIDPDVRPSCIDMLKDQYLAEHKVSYDD